ncbi:sensor histidine kinase [Thalassotalea mangrovi]|uniref:histidine kinase n=1 Tax=Thalassotalea mangrovi TaxID=2572245 RepID=A0A4U1B663_9GAMM|nr:HAMP domain-containing sensor histidine kinase [Thalassotalea mangrovi]TKB45963.1 HAMP domain-containing histidine kinase [Thalassotalea mangrovi]
MYRHSLRRRVALAFALCIAVLSIVWGFAFFAAIKLSEDRVLVNQLQSAAESYPAIPENLRAYDDINQLPKSLQGWAQSNPDAGLYEFTSEELHVAVVPSEHEPRHAFVVFDVAGIEAASSEDWWWLLIVTAVVISLGALGFCLGMMVMRKAVAPVAQLANVVADIDPEKLSADDHKRIESSRFGNDEVGVLATTIEKTFERISAFVERERYFTNAVSHELRTPITVITGALELLAQNDLPAADVKAVDRARRATTDMKTIIDMFLCLARETDDGLYYGQFLVMPLVQKAIEQQGYLLRGKCIDVEIDEIEKTSVYGHSQAFSIAINNLVRNAFEHTLDGQGPITISIEEHQLLVTNQVSGDVNNRQMPAETSFQGYGLGLGIVQRLCERNGWSFSLINDDMRVIARLAW